MRWSVISLHSCNKSHSDIYLEFVFLPEKCKQGKESVSDTPAFKLIEEDFLGHDKLIFCLAVSHACIFNPPVTDLFIRKLTPLMKELIDV